MKILVDNLKKVIALVLRKDDIMSWDPSEDYRQRQIVDNTRIIAEELKRQSSKDAYINSSYTPNISYHSGPVAKNYMSFGKKLWSFFMWDSVVGLPLFALITFGGAIILSKIPIPALTEESFGIPNYLMITGIVGIIVWIVLAIIKIKKLRYK